MLIAPPKQAMAEINITPGYPMKIIAIETIIEKIQYSAPQNDTLAFLMFSGIISVITVNVKDWMPSDEKKLTIITLINGINFERSPKCSGEIKIAYTHIIIRLKDDPMADTMIKI